MFAFLPMKKRDHSFCWAALDLYRYSAPVLGFDPIKGMDHQELASQNPIAPGRQRRRCRGHFCDSLVRSQQLHLSPDASLAMPPRAIRCAGLTACLVRASFEAAVSSVFNERLGDWQISRPTWISQA